MKKPQSQKLSVFIALIMFLPIVSNAQEKVMIEGAVVIGHNEDPTPAIGTIRFDTATNDFQGWNGMRWVSLSLVFPTGLITDIDGNVYKTLPIGNQIWMIENLKTTKYANGDPIPDGTGVGDISGETDPKYWFAYDDDPNIPLLKGLLYTWHVVNDGRGLCPTGWHVPNTTEWNELIDLLGGFNNPEAAGKMKETGTLQEGTGLWFEPNVGATNASGFSARPAGLRGTMGSFGVNTSQAYWWSSRSANSSLADVINVLHSGGPGPQADDKKFGHSVRCIKD